jgi:hypothetical protein
VPVELAHLVERSRLVVVRMTNLAELHHPLLVDRAHRLAREARSGVNGSCEIEPPDTWPFAVALQIEAQRAIVYLAADQWLDRISPDE